MAVVSLIKTGINNIHSTWTLSSSRLWWSNLWALSRKHRLYSTGYAGTSLFIKGNITLSEKSLAETSSKWYHN